MPPSESRDKAKWHFHHWAGTLEQLVDATRHLARETAELVPMPDEDEPEPDPSDSYDGEEGQARRGRNQERYRQRLEAETARRVSIVVEEKEGFTKRPATVDEFAALSDTTRRSVENIVITVGSAYGAPRGELRCGKSYIHGMILEVEGFDRTWTAGVKHEVTTILKPPWRLHALGNGNENVWILLAPASFFASFIGLVSLFVGVADWARAVSISAALVGGALAAGCVILIGIAGPQFELLGPSERPRYQRWRGRVFSAVGAVVLALIASAIWAVASGN